MPAPPTDLNGPATLPYPAVGTEWIGSSILDLFRRCVEAAPGQVAVDDGVRQLTRRQLWNGACRLAVAIEEKTPAGQPIGVLLPNEAPYAIAVLGCLAAGRPCVVLDRHYPAVRNRAIVDRAGLAGLVLDPGDVGNPTLYPPELPAVAVEPPVDRDEPLLTPPAPIPAPDDPTLIVYTSGSTGAPKGIALSQRAVLHRAGELIDSLHMGAGDVSLPLASPCTIAGALQMFEALLSGALLFKVDLQRAGLTAVLDVIRQKQATLLFATPALLRLMARLDGVRDRLASLRCVHPSGEVLLAADLELLRDCLPPECRILLVYGLTEAPAICQWFVPHGHAAAGARVAVGYRLPGYECAVLDEEQRPVPPGETGELVVRSRFTALGDWQDGRVEPGPFTADPADSQTRILRTGDLVSVREGGAISVVGRKDRQVQIHGMRVEPYEIENVLRRSEGVLDAAVIARRDGEVPVLVAFVVLAREQGDDGIRQVRGELQRALPTYMHPARVIPIEALPLLPGHKVDVEALVALDSASESRDAGEPCDGAMQAPLVREAVAQAWRALFGAVSLEADMPFCDAGGDSLGLLQFVFQLEAACGTRLPFSSFSICMRPSEVERTVEDFIAAHPLPLDTGRSGRIGAALPPSRNSALVLLRPGEGTPPVFIAHGLGGHVGELAALGRHLRTRHPLYALQASGIEGGEPANTIEDIAQYFCGAIQAAEHEGPYLLIGYSLGGLVMLEVARRLGQSGREVGLLALLDTYPHPRFWPMRSWLSYLLQRIMQQGSDAMRLPPREIVPQFVELAGDFVEHLSFRLGLDRRPRDPAGAAVAPALRRMRESLTGAEARYRPRPYAGTITFFQAEDAEGAPHDPTLVWGDLADRVEVVTVPGGHVAMVFTATLAARISERLASALGEQLPF